MQTQVGYAQDKACQTNEQEQVRRVLNKLAAWATGGESLGPVPMGVSTATPAGNGQKSEVLAGLRSFQSEFKAMSNLAPVFSLPKYEELTR